MAVIICFLIWEKGGDAEAERKRHDKALEQLEAEAQDAWSKTKNRKIRFHK